MRRSSNPNVESIDETDDSPVEGLEEGTLAIGQTNSRNETGTYYVYTEQYKCVVDYVQVAKLMMVSVTISFVVVTDGAIQKIDNARCFLIKQYFYYQTYTNDISHEQFQPMEAGYILKYLMRESCPHRTARMQLLKSSSSTIS